MVKKTKMPRGELLRMIAENKVMQTGAIIHGRGINVKAFAEEARSRGLLTLGLSGRTELYARK